MHSDMDGRGSPQTLGLCVEKGTEELNEVGLDRGGAVDGLERETKERRVTIVDT